MAAEGLLAPMQLHDYIVSQLKIRWPIKEVFKELEN